MTGCRLREQLVRFFRKGVADGALQSGIRLPASRVLAQELKLVADYRLRRL
jgi:GntR family transcriptional regulator/MocR family aminotransferase